MRKDTLKNKPLFQSTLGDLVECVKEELGLSQIIEDTSEKKSKLHVYGIAGLAKLLSCSIPTAQRIKSSGVIDEAISQCGKIIVVDADLALDLLRLSNNKWGRKSNNRKS